jgi:hypothetical protein
MANGMKKELGASKLPPNTKIKIMTILNQFRDKLAHKAEA